MDDQESSNNKDQAKSLKTSPRTRIDTLERGTEAFMRWLGSENRISASSNPIILKQFVRNRYTVLYDSTLGQDVIVEIHNGVPFCRSCNADDCGHVGFTILLGQKYENDGTIFD